MVSKCHSLLQLRQMKCRMLPCVCVGGGGGGCVRACGRAGGRACVQAQVPRTVPFCLYDWMIVRSCKSGWSVWKPLNHTKKIEDTAQRDYATFHLPRLYFPNCPIVSLIAGLKLDHGLLCTLDAVAYWIYDIFCLFCLQVLRSIYFTQIQDKKFHLW